MSVTPAAPLRYQMQGAGRPLARHRLSWVSHGRPRDHRPEHPDVNVAAEFACVWVPKRFNPMRRRRISPLLLLGAALLFGCAGSTEAEQEFENALGRWRRAGLVNYSYRSTVSCFCASEYIIPMTVTVRNGAVVSVVDRATGASRPLTYRVTIDSLFSTAAEEIRVRPERLQVTYDVALGFPRSLTYGTPENDGGGFIRADSLAVVP